MPDTVNSMVWIMLNTRQRQQAETFRDYLNAPGQMLVFTSPVIQEAYYDSDIKVACANQESFHRRFAGIKQKFRENILQQGGLYELAVDYPHDALGAQIDAVSIATIHVGDEILTTMHTGKPKSEEFRFISLVIPRHDGSDPSIKGLQGSHEELAAIVDVIAVGLAAEPAPKRFHAFKGKPEIFQP